MSDMSDMSAIPAVQANNVHYMVQIPEKEDKNFFEGLMWGVNGVQNLVGGISAVGGALFLDVMALGTISMIRSPADALAGTVGLTALNVLAFYVVKAEFSIASKSFTHMKNTIL